MNSNPNDCLKRVKIIYSKYIDTNDMNINLLAHWIIGTYKHSEFEAFPFLNILARKQSGKTRTQKLTSALSFRGDGSICTSPTEALLFRNKDRPLFFDEMENISSKERGSFREVLNACYKKGNKIIRYTEKRNRRTGKKEYVEDVFTPYYPISLANINGLTDTLEDRSIQIILQRSQNPKVTKLIEDFSTNPEIIELKEALYNLNLDIPKDLFTQWNHYSQNLNYNASLKDFFDKIEKSNIQGRQFEIFLPLFVISYLCDDLDSFLKTAQDYLKTLEGQYVDNIDDVLVEFVTLNQDNTLFKGFVKMTYLLNEFRSYIDEPQDWVNSKWFGRALKRLGFVNKKRLINGHTEIELKYNNNSTNSINSINYTNTTNSTNNKYNQVELVEKVDKIGYIDINNNPLNSCALCGSNDAFILIGEGIYCTECARSVKA